MSKIKYLLQYWGPAFLIMAIIFGFSSLPSKDLPDFGILDYLVKKGGHALGYGLLALSFLRGLKAEKKSILPSQLFIAWGLAVLYSTTDEYHQSFTPGRYPAVTDVLIDSAGAAGALYLAYKYYKK